MEASGKLLETAIEVPGERQIPVGGSRYILHRLQYPIYGLALALSISVWFIAIRAPLWLDETISFFLIKGGFAEIMSRQGWPDVPVYYYLLWLWTKVMGTGEITLRISSVLAMIGAVYLLYRAARELFDRDVAIIAAIVFCLHQVVIFESIDVRPYAFAALTVNASIFTLVRLRRSNSTWLAALFGLSAACIAYFHFLFVVILPPLAISFIALRIGDRKILWRQLGVALGVFALAFLPVIPGLLYMFHTSGTHVWAPSPRLEELGVTLGMRWLGAILVGTVLLAAATRRLDLRSHFEGWPLLLCASLGLIPILILYGVSLGTSEHIFVFRYRLVAIPGIALCWALIVNRIDSRALRLLFCMAIVATAVYEHSTAPDAKQHGPTWKYALEFAQKNASADNAPVLICSDLPESDYRVLPVGAAVKDNALFAPLTYYKLTVPVVGLPRSLNDEATRIGSQFLHEATLRRERFLALAFPPSYDTLDWLQANAEDTYHVRELGTFDDIMVMEFTPSTPVAAAR
jgi:hypothetical protein